MIRRSKPWMIFTICLISFGYPNRILVFGKAPLLEDNVAILNVAGLPDVNGGWTDSYSDGDSCYCATTFDHGIGTIVVDTPLGKMTVREVCEMLGEGPTGSRQGRPLYNDIQCGNGPPNNAGDETGCPGRTEYGQEGCKYIGPKWNFDPFLPPAPTLLDTVWQFLQWIWRFLGFGG
jgi:hypothetical protein